MPMSCRLRLSVAWQFIALCCTITHADAWQVRDSVAATVLLLTAYNVCIAGAHCVLVRFLDTVFAPR
jgi:hypothetical protein